jgi:hypothetical protein
VCISADEAGGKGGICWGGSVTGCAIVEQVLFRAQDSQLFKPATFKMENKVDSHVCLFDSSRLELSTKNARKYLLYINQLSKMQYKIKLHKMLLVTNRNFVTCQ